MTRTSYTSFHPNKDKLVYKDKITGQEITCDLTLLNMAMTVMKPQLVVEHKVKEIEVEELTLAKAGNDVCSYLTKIQEKRNKIDMLQKDNAKFDDQRWLTLTFEQLVKTRCSDFLEDVKRQQSEIMCWHDKPVHELQDHWRMGDVSSQQFIIALATALANECAKNKSNKGNNTGKSNG